MARILYDSINANDIPTTVQMVGGYIDGIYVWSQANWDRFPNSTKVKIAVSPFTNDGHVLDVETGDATPAQVPGWVLMRLASGLSCVTIYCNRDNRSAVEIAMRAASISNAQACLWVATDDGTQYVPTGFYGVAAVQYANPSHGSGGHYDLTIVSGAWPGVDTFGPNGGSLGNIMTLDEKREEIQNLFDLCFGITAPSQPILDNGDQNGSLAWTLSSGQAGNVSGVGLPGAMQIADDGGNLDEVRNAFMTHPKAVARLAALNAIIMVGPAQQSLTMAQVDAEIAKAVAALPVAKPSLWDVLRNTVWPS